MTDPVLKAHPAAAAEVPRRLPVVAIVGRPNAGKSMLFNRLVRAERAIVDAQPGVTRDRNIALARWDDRGFLLVDTGGFEGHDASSLAAAVRVQATLAAEEADAVIVVFDGREGLNPLDGDFVQRLRHLEKPVFYAVNKLDTPALDDAATDFFALGVSEVFPISTAHGRGIGELMDRLVAQLPEFPAAEENVGAEYRGAIRLAIVGRPNVGKSSLLNRIVGFERAIVDATPGTTRDPLDTEFRRGDQRYILVDTAGIRRRPRVQEHLERASVVRSLRALERAEVAVLVIDAAEGMTDQDARIGGYAWERGRALLFAVNKWDVVPRAQRDRKTFLRAIGEHYPTLADVPAVCLSALSGTGVHDLFPAVEKLVAAHRGEARTVHLNEVLAATTQAHAAPSIRGKPVRFYYATQTGTAPPQITLFTNLPNAVAPAYQRYLSSAFRDAFAWHGTPLRLLFRARHAERPPRAAGHRRPRE